MPVLQGIYWVHFFSSVTLPVSSIAKLGSQHLPLRVVRTTCRNIGKAHFLTRCTCSTAQEMAGLCFLTNLFLSPPLSKEDLIYSMCFARGPSPEKLASPFRVYFLSLTRFCSFSFCLFTYTMIKHSLGSLGSISGWQGGVEPPLSSSLSLEL